MRPSAIMLDPEEPGTARPEGLVCVALLATLLWLSWPLVAARVPFSRPENALDAAPTVVGMRVAAALVYRWLALDAVGRLCTGAPPPTAAPSVDHALRVVAIRPLHGTASWLERNRIVRTCGCMWMGW